MLPTEKLWVAPMVNITSWPRKSTDITVPVAAESNSGKRALPVRSSISTSKVKTSAAMGALKMAAIAAVEPQANSRVVCRVLRWKNRATFEPMALPVSTIGASNPTEPPNPTVTALATMEE